jgi:putative N6-adenine-specific DNA methylase
MKGDIIEIECRDIKDFEEPSAPALMIVNPPYGERLVLENLLQVYKELGARLKHAFQGNEAWIISSSYDCFDQVGLKASARIPLYNGDLDCEFRKYELFQGKYKGFRGEGNELKKDFAPLKRKSRLTGLDGGTRPSRSERGDEDFSSEIDSDSMRRRRELESYFGTAKARRIVAGRGHREENTDRPERAQRRPYADRREGGERRDERGQRRTYASRPDARNGEKCGGNYGGRGRGNAADRRGPRGNDGGKRRPGGDFKPLRGGKRDKR